MKAWPQLLFCVCHNTPQPEDALDKVFLSQCSSGAWGCGWMTLFLH